MTDVHIHIERGPYTKEWIDRFAAQAVERGFQEIYLLEHSHRFDEFAPMYDEICRYSEYQRNWYVKKRFGLIAVCTDLIQRMREEEFPVKIKWGLEICWFPEQANLIAQILRSFDFDFATGSVHWLDGFGFDHAEELWDGIDVDWAYKRCYELMRSLVQSGLFTGLAHPDSIKEYCKYPSFDLIEIYEALADDLVRRGVYAEQSSGLFHRGHFAENGMNAAMLEVFRQKGVAIRFASDAHRPEDVGACYIPIG